MKSIKFYKCIIAFMFLISIGIKAQQNLPDKFKIAHKNYFNDLRENVHLHLNKTVFYKGEQLWFSAYIFDQKTQKPSIENSNLHVGIFDKEGNLLKKKMIYIQDGVGHNNFAIDSSFTHNDYYIKAETNWMRNFKESKAYVQNFTVLDQLAFKSTIANKEQHSSFLIFPEGGSLVNNLKNTIAFKVSDSLGVGYKLDNIELVNDLNEIIISNISTSKKGLGKISFFLKEGRSYFLRVKNENEYLINTPLPTAKNHGLVLNLNQVDNKILGKLLVSEQELGQWINKPAYVAVHRNGEISIIETIIQSEETVFNLKKWDIPLGVNTITILDSFKKPKLSRLFFNDFSIENLMYSDLAVRSKINNTKDSIIVELNTDQESLDTLSLSISVLPAESISYSSMHSLATSFLLSKYVSDSPVISNYDFQKLNRGELFELDILMILQGDGMFKWNSIMNGLPDIEHSFESGIVLKGRIMDANLSKEKQIWGSVTERETNFFSEIKSDKTFEANVILYQGDSLKMALLNNKGKLRKPRAEISFSEFMEIQPLESPPSKQMHFIEASDLDDSFLDQLSKSKWTTGLTKGVTKLDEVILYGNKNLNNEIPINSAEFSGKRITDDDIKRRGTLEAYLIKLGYRISINGGRVTVLSQTPSPTSMGQRVPVPVFVGGMISDGSDLLNKPLSQIQAVYYDSFGYEFISIIPRYDFYSGKKTKRYEAFLVKNGFSRPEEYYDPGYYNYQTREFQNFGVIDWLPKIVVNSKPTTIKIPILDQQKLLFKIEGMSSDGRLISETKEIDIQQID